MTNSANVPVVGPSRVQAIVWADDHLRLLDQRLLPMEERYIECRDVAQTAAAIRDMVVRGAPAIGITAAFGIALAARGGEALDHAEAILAASRPTAVNLHWALARQGCLWRNGADAQTLLAEAQRIHAEDIAQNLHMAELGATLIEPGSTVLTHCNTGALATGGHGTALGVIRSAWAAGRLAQIYHTETRPWLQGARLTAWELKQDGIPARMIVDGAAAHLMQTQRVDWVIVGADRIAANGDTANKIGTYQLAVGARAHGVHFMVVAPTGTFDLNCADGAGIPIEQRAAGELTRLQGRQIAPARTDAYNPVFDVTPAALIDAIVCERGVIGKPDCTKIVQLLGEE